MVTHNHGFFRKYAGRIYTFGNQSVTEQGKKSIEIGIDDIDEVKTITKPIEAENIDEKANEVHNEFYEQPEINCAEQNSEI